MQRHIFSVVVALGLLVAASPVRADDPPPADSNTATPSDSSPAPAATAAPVPEASSAPTAEAKPEDKKDGKKKDDKPAPPQEAQAAAAAALLGPPSGLQLTFSWSNSVGVATDPALRYLQSSFQVNANYKLHPKVFFAAAFTPLVNVPINPTGIPSDNRILDTTPFGNFVRLNFRNLYKEEITGVAVGASATYQLPVTYTDFLAFTNPGKGNPRLGGLGAALQLFRQAGPLTLVGVLAANKPLFLFRQPIEICTPTPARSCAPNGNTGSNNVDYTLSAGLTAILPLGNWVFFGAISALNATSYGPALSSNPTNTAATLPGNQRFSSSFFVQAGYTLNEHWTANLGTFNVGPQLDSNAGYNNPFFDAQYTGVFFGFDYVN